MATNPPNDKKSVQLTTRIRLVSVDANKKKDAQISGLDLLVEPTEVKANGEFIEVWFRYRVDYKEDVGHIEMTGIVLIQTEKQMVKQMVDFYNEHKYFDSPIAENLANAINFKCATDAIFPAKIIDLPPPIMPPRIQMAGAPNAGKAAGAPQQGQPQPEQQQAPPAQPNKPASGPAAGPGTMPGMGQKPQFGATGFPPGSNPFKKH